MDSGIATLVRESSAIHARAMAKASVQAPAVGSQAWKEWRMVLAREARVEGTLAYCNTCACTVGERAWEHRAAGHRVGK